MRLAFCITVKNRSCVIVDNENSLSFLHHMENKLEASPQTIIKPLVTKDQKLVLLLLPNMLRSLVKHKRPEDDWVVVIVDYNSSDIDMKEMLEEELGDKIPWQLEVISDYAFFDRGGGLANAAEIAQSKFQADGLFFCDADLLFSSRDVLDKAIESIKREHFFYPIFFSFALPDHTVGFWRDTSFGNFACSCQSYKKTEGWYHNISWGWEDRALSDSIPEELKDREQVPGFYHQWHPFQWEFRVKEYPVKEYLFKAAAVKSLPSFS